MENSIVIRYNYSFSRDIISTCILGDEIMKISNFPFKMIFYISFPSIPLRSLEVSVSHAYTTPSPSFLFVSIGMDDEGCGIEKGGIWKNITVARSNGMDGTTRSCPPSIIHWPDRYVWVCRPCVCARTKTEEGMGGEMSGGDRWNVDGVKRGYKRRGGVESEGRFKTLEKMLLECGEILNVNRQRFRGGVVGRIVEYVEEEFSLDIYICVCVWKF